MTSDLARLRARRDRINSWFEKNGVSFYLHRQGALYPQTAPCDPIPRVVSAEDFTHIEAGLMQRANALNLFLCDVYGSRMIIRDGVIPEEFIFASQNYSAACIGWTPLKRIYNHISATDLLQSEDGQWYVMQDNLSLPAGFVYPYVSRRIDRAVDPEFYQVDTLCDNNGFGILLNQLYTDILNAVDTRDGIPVILSQGEDSPSHFELRTMAEISSAVLAAPDELSVMDDAVYYRPSGGGGFQRVGVVHRQATDRTLDPLAFDVRSRLGVPHLMEAYRRGKVAIINSPGSALADEKGIYCFVPDMIRYYLGEEPILPNVPTFLPSRKEDMEYISDNMEKLVIKDASGDATVSSVHGSSMSRPELDGLRERLLSEPRSFYAQKPMKAASLPALSEDGGSIVECRADFRAYTVHCDSIRVWMGGLTRFSREQEHSGNRPFGGFKDTWVMSE